MCMGVCVCVCVRVIKARQSLAMVSKVMTHQVTA